MISIFIPAWLTGLLTSLAYAASLTVWGSLVILLGLVRLIPLPAPLKRITKALPVLAATHLWEATNKFSYHFLHPVSWQIDDRLQKLDPKKSYLIISNHQAWADITLLFNLFHLRLPFLRFFLKRELVYVPFIGLSCWALDMPFMNRHSKEALEKNPALRGTDLATTRRACEIYKQQPVAIVNFLEGTRFTEAKRVAKQSPYRHLLRPKSAGLSFMLNAMGEQFGGIIDITIGYTPTPRKNLTWSWLCGEQNHMQIHMDLLPIPPEMIHGDYEADPDFRARFQTWVNGIWSRKDARLERMLNSAPLSSARPALQ